MSKELESSNNLSRLKAKLSRLVFAQVIKSTAHDEDIMCFTNLSGSTTYDYDPSFQSDMQELQYAEKWDAAEKSYKKYFGFATVNPKIEGLHTYFNNKGHTWDQDLSGLNTFDQNKQNPCTPPVSGSWIVGTLGQQYPNSKGPWFNHWQVCDEGEKNFIECLLGRKKLEPDHLVDFVISRGDKSGLLVIMSVILILRNFEMLLIERKLNPSITDSKVFEICDQYDYAFWLQYREKALEKRIYSELIPEPAPKKIESRMEASNSAAVGLSTPFKVLDALVLK